MKLFESNAKKILQETMDAITLTRREHDSDKIIDLIMLINSLEDFYYLLSQKENRTITEFIHSNHINKIYLEFEQKHNENFIKNFIDNKQFHGDLALSSLKKLQNVLQEDTNIYTMPKLSNRKMLKIMNNYLISINQKKLLTDIINNRNLFEIKNINNFIGGQIFNTINSKSYIFVNKDVNVLEKMNTIIHELGHAWDSLELAKRNGIYQQYYHYDSIYIEVISKQFEKKFLNYLIENNILVNDTSILLNDFYHDITDYLVTIEFLASLDNKFLEDENYKRIDSKILSGEFAGNFIKKDLTVDIVDIEDIDLTKELYYGYGGLVAIYFTQLERDDYDKFKYIYKQFLDNRYKPFNVDIFNKFVGSKENLIDATVNELTRDYQLIKTKNKKQ